AAGAPLAGVAAGAPPAGGAAPAPCPCSPPRPPCWDPGGGDRPRAWLRAWTSLGVSRELANNPVPVFPPLPTIAICWVACVICDVTEAGTPAALAASVICPPIEAPFCNTEEAAAPGLKLNGWKGT